MMNLNTDKTKTATERGAVVELDGDDFDASLTSRDTVLVDFWAPWCGPCRAFAPVYEATARKHPEVLFAKVNVDKHQALAARYGIRAIPTLIAFRNGSVVFSQAGALPLAALETVVNEVTKARMNPRSSKGGNE